MAEVGCDVGEGAGSDAAAVLLAEVCDDSLQHDDVLTEYGAHEQLEVLLGEAQLLAQREVCELDKA